MWGELRRAIHGAGIQVQLGVREQLAHYDGGILDLDVESCRFTIG